MPEHLFSLSQDPLLKFALLGALSKFVDAGVAVTRHLHLNLIGLSGSERLLPQLRKVEKQYFQYELGPLADDRQEQDFALDMGDPFDHASMIRGTTQNIVSTVVDTAGTLLATSPEMLAFTGTRLGINVLANALYWPLYIWRSYNTQITL